MDLSTVSTEDLKAFQSGDLSKVSTGGLKTLSAASSDPRGEKIDKYLAETDEMLGFTPGTSARQINQESRFDSKAFNKGSQAAGIAQVIPATVKSLSSRMGRPLDPHNDDDALLMHRELMWENKNRFVNQEDALRAYNAGWDKKRWDNPETNNYVRVVSFGQPSPPPAPAAVKAVAEDGKAISYVPWAPIRKDVEQSSLNTDRDWIKASQQLYKLRERKAFPGSDSEVAEWGKEFMGWFNWNTVGAALYGKDVVMNGSQDDKRAMVYMMETTSPGNTNLSWEGTGRALKGLVTDPSNIASVASLGIGGVAKTLAATAAKEGLKKALITSLGRTGIVAGIDTGIISGVTNSIDQTIKTSAGAQDSFSKAELAGSMAVGAAAGVVLGTVADAAATKIINTVRRNLPKKSQSTVRAVPEPVVEATPPVEPSVRPTVASDLEERGLPKAAREFSTPEEFDNHFRVGPASSLMDRFSLSVDQNHTSSQGSLFHGTSGAAAIDILGAGGIEPRMSAGDVLGETAVSLSPMKQGGGSYGSVIFEVDRTASGATDATARAMGPDAIPESEFRTGDRIPLDAVRRVIIDLGSKEDLSTSVGYRAGKSVTARDVKEAAEAKGLDVVVVKNGDNLKAIHTPEALDIPSPESLQSNQKGRLWTDELPPVTAANPEAAAKIDIPDTGEGLRSTPRTNAMTREAGGAVTDQLKALNDTDLHGVLEEYRTGSYTEEERAVIDAGVMFYAGEMKDAEVSLLKRIANSEDTAEIAAIRDELNTVQARLIPLTNSNTAMGNAVASRLQQRRMGPLRDSVDSLMVERNIDREEAEGLYVAMYDASKQDREVAKVTSSYESRIDEALAEGDNAGAAYLTVMKNREVDALVEQKMPGSASFMHKAYEYTISAVFSPSTIVVNILAPALKTLVRPVLHALSTDILKAETRVGMMATYGAMRSTMGASMRTARASLIFEQSLLTRSSGMLVEGELAIEGRKGGVIRLLPRILNATDEFLSQVNYNGFVAHKAAGESMVEAARKGLTGKDLDQYVKLDVEIALKNAFGQKSGDALVQPVVNKGVNLGLTGEALQEYVEKNAVKYAEELRHGSDKESLEYTRDVLYKRDFSGNGAVSKLAKGYQDWTNTTPTLKLALGQLFFRTPVRVFEEGIRLTPGLQLVAPGFVADLKGANGAMRQARAQGEALTSIAITGAVLSLYAQGKITGDGATDNWKQARTNADGSTQPANSVKMSDDSSWVYRNLDPISTPVKIIINGLERMDKLALRQAQGEEITDTMWHQGMAYLTVGTSAIGAALRDANLAAGVDGGIKLYENLKDPEGKEDAWLKFFGQKLAFLVPNTFTKIAKINDPTMRDPADFWQMIETRLAGIYVDREDIKTSYSYDVLGNVRKIADTGVLYSLFSLSTQEEQAKDLSPEAQAVFVEIKRLERETNTTFYPQVKVPELGGMDLRTVLTSDKQETLYDRWQRLYREKNPDKVLYQIVQVNAPDGTRQDPGVKPTLLLNRIKALQRMALVEMMRQEQPVLDAYRNTRLDNAKSKAGFFDFKNSDK